MQSKLMRLRLVLTRAALVSSRFTVTVVCAVILVGCFVIVLLFAFTGWMAYEGIRTVKA